MDKNIKLIAVAAFIISAVSLVVAWNSGTIPLGATWNGGTSHTNSQFDAVGGFSVNGGTVISSSTAFTIGSGTAIVKTQCAANSVSIGALVPNGTTTFDFALTGATTSKNQAYFFGNATTSVPGTFLNFHVNPTSTTGFVNIFVVNQTTSTISYGGATSTISVCYLQF